MEKKTFHLDLRIEGVPEHVLASILNLIVDIVHDFGGTVGGGYTEVDSNPPSVDEFSGPGYEEVDDGSSPESE